MVKIDVNELPERLADMLQLAEVEQEPIVVQRSDEGVVAIIPIQSYNFLRRLEDRFVQDKLAGLESPPVAGRSVGNR